MKIETFLNQYPVPLATEKMEIFHSDACPKLVWGVSGSGKTTTMLVRSAYLISQEEYKANEILNLTLNKDASKHFEDSYTNTFEGLSRPKTIDIYSFAYNVLKKYMHFHRKPLRKAYKELTPMIARLCKDFFNLLITKEQAFILLSEISQYRNAGSACQHMVSSIDGVELKLLVDEYAAMKARKEVMDYDDIIWDCIKALQSDAALVAELQKQYRVILVDDAQDLCYGAHLILNLMKGLSELVYFADQDSSVLPLEADNVLVNFEKIYQDGKVFTLNGNYRCSQTIWQKACEFKKLSNQEAYREEESEIKFKNFAELSRLYAYAATKANDGVQTAFLYRHFAMAAPLVEYLESKKIPYQFKGNIKHFIQDKIVTDLWNLIELLIDSRDMRAFYEVYRLLGLDVSKRVLAEINERIKNEELVDVYHALMESSMKASMKQRLQSIIENIRIAETLPSEQMIQFIIEKLDYGLYLKMMGRSSQDPVLLALLAIARRYPKPDEFLYRLSNLLEAKSSMEANVVITAMDSVKGVAFERVCILDGMKGILPRKEDAIERNVFYHAMTRAKNELEFFTAKQAGEQRLYASPYLFELYKKETVEPKVVAPIAKKKLRMADLKVGMKIQHVNFGEGVIKKVNVSMIQIQFKEEVKVLNTKLCIQNEWISLI